MKKIVFYLLTGLITGIISLSCDDLENTNAMSQDTVRGIESGVQRSALYSEIKNKIAGTTYTYNGQTYPGNEVFNTYFADHKVVKVNFEESAFSTILNRRIRMAETDLQKEAYEDLYEECLRNYENAAYSVSLGVYSKLSRVNYEFKQAILLNNNYDVIDVICYTSAADSTLFNTDFPCK